MDGILNNDHFHVFKLFLLVFLCWVGAMLQRSPSVIEPGGLEGGGIESGFLQNGNRRGGSLKT